MGSVAVFGHFAGFFVAAFLALEPDFEDFHRRDHGDRFCYTGC